jgi:hypothetical protein
VRFLGLFRVFLRSFRLFGFFGLVLLGRLGLGYFCCNFLFRLGRSLRHRFWSRNLGQSFFRDRLLHCYVGIIFHWCRLLHCSRLPWSTSYFLLGFLG